MELVLRCTFGGLTRIYRKYAPWHDSVTYFYDMYCYAKHASKIVCVLINRIMCKNLSWIISSKMIYLENQLKFSYVYRGNNLPLIAVWILSQILVRQ
jgi:hypothetical protein